MQQTELHYLMEQTPLLNWLQSPGVLRELCRAFRDNPGIPARIGPDLYTCSNLKYLLSYVSRYKRPTGMLQNRLIQAGNLNLLKRWDPKGIEAICQMAAWHGQLPVLQWARANDAPWDVYTCAWAARRGHLHVLQWARANGAKWDTMTCEWAARNGHLEVLQWAWSEYAPWNRHVRAGAVENDQQHVVDWIDANVHTMKMFNLNFIANGRAGLSYKVN